jgi:hypothetical protein
MSFFIIAGLKTYLEESWQLQTVISGIVASFLYEMNKFADEIHRYL